MLPGMRFYIVSIVSIFTALGIGVYIGFSMDTQEFVLDQKENIINILESQFETVIEESASIKEVNKELEEEIKLMDEYINSSYNFLTKNKLEGINVGIIQTNPDYEISGISKDLELAGAKLMSLTSLNKSIVNREDLDEFIPEILEYIINGKGDNELTHLEDDESIDYVGSFNEAIDYLIISGGGLEDSTERINKIDKLIIDIAKSYNIPVIGVEKSDVGYSYMESYKDLGITTVDNIDMVMGKAAMILAMEGIPGNYGIKPTAKTLIPISMDVVFE